MCFFVFVVRRLCLLSRCIRIVIVLMFIFICLALPRRFLLSRLFSAFNFNLFVLLFVFVVRIVFVLNC